MPESRRIVFGNKDVPVIQVYWHAGASNGGFTLRPGEHHEVDGGANVVRFGWKDWADAFTAEEKTRIMSVSVSTITFTRNGNPPGYVGDENEGE